MRYCGVDISAKPANQQLVTLHERRAPEGGVELVATFYAPGTVEQLARTIEGFGRGQAVVAVDAPSGPRLDLLAAGAPLRDELGLPDGRYERMRVCDALLFRRGLPLYPVPAAGQSPQGWEQWIGVGFELFAALARLGLFRPETRERADRAGRLRGAALRPPLRDLSRRDLLRRCSATGRRRSARRGGCSSGSRRCARKGVQDADGGLWHRTLDELDACAAAYAAYALAAGLGLWVGAPEEGVIVLPVDRAARPLREAPAARARSARLIDPTYTGWAWRRPAPDARRSPATRPPPREGRAKQRAFVVGALPEGDLAELKELLRTSGVAVVGELIQRRDQPHPNLYLGPGKVERAQGS